MRYISHLNCIGFNIVYELYYIRSFHLFHMISFSTSLWFIWHILSLRDVERYIFIFSWYYCIFKIVINYFHSTSIINQYRIFSFILVCNTINKIILAINHKQLSNLLEFRCNPNSILEVYLELVVCIGEVLNK